MRDAGIPKALIQNERQTLFRERAFLTRVNLLRLSADLAPRVCHPL
jgi:hypothetical protein